MSQKKAPHQMKMVEFVPYLFKKYKVLNSLSPQQQSQFQNQIVTLLVDHDQNVDSAIYQKMINEVGLAEFVLEILASVIKHQRSSKDKSGNELQMMEIARKNKILVQRENKIKQTQEQQFKVLQQKADTISSEVHNKISRREAQFKKTISLLLNQLKNKQKLICDRQQYIKQNAKILTDLQAKQKVVNEKIRNFDKKQKQVKARERQITTLKKETEIDNLKLQLQKCGNVNKELLKKIKNLDMAYKKAKNDSQKKQKIYEEKGKNKQPERKEQKAQRKQVSFQKLDISIIEESKQNQLFFGEEEEEESFKITFHEQEPKQNSLLDNLQQISLQTSEQKATLLESNELLTYITFCQQAKYPKDVTLLILNVMLELISSASEDYENIINYLGINRGIIEFIQHSYLLHQTHQEIAETSLLIVSRVMLKFNEEVCLEEEFIRAIGIRAKAEDEGSFLFKNIRSILR